MTKKEKEFIDFWDKKRKEWRWKKHIIINFQTYALPLAILIDLMNFFIIGDTEYLFFSIEHIFIFTKNLVLISVFIIMVSGIFSWSYNENRYWQIQRKYRKKLQ